MKPLAPYGEHSSLTDGHVSIIFIGKYSYERAISLREGGLFPFTMYLPPNTSPLDFSWPIKGQEIYLLDTSKSQLSFVRFCAVCFFSYGANKINYISQKLNSIIEKGISHG